MNSTGYKNVKTVQRNGFTILELLVSMTVLALLLVILMSMVDGATRLWRQSENRVDSYREARAALNIITSDLRSAYISTNTNFFKIEDKALWFLSAVPGAYQEQNSNKSDLCEVGYTWSYERPDVLLSREGIPESYNIYRTFNSSDPTFSHIRSNTQFESGTRELLARNIVDFQVRAFTLDADGTPEEFKAPTADHPMPDVVQVTIKALNNETAQKFKKADWSDENSDLYKKNVRTFTTRVRFPTDFVTSPTPSPTP